ncbi:MAG: HAMP domain-containing histidine kinase [Variovorax sp.]|nr:MAG: HAMP domain-containing histidine kinase [Variovorax sp.]
MRDDFMSMVSLNTLFLETQVRKLHLGKGNMALFSPERLTAMIERDQRQIQNMVRLIDDMLDVTRMRSGALSIQPKPMDLAALTRNVGESFAHQAEAAGSTTEAHAPRQLEGVWDEFRIEQVLSNLLTDALRYGGGGPVEIHLQEDEDDGGERVARLCVRDHGMDIAPEDLARIFEQFERTDDSRRRAAGLGLGLYITRQIVLAHEGRIGVDSAQGEGALFTVRLPLAPAT